MIDDCYEFKEQPSLVNANPVAKEDQEISKTQIEAMSSEALSMKFVLA